MTENLRLNDIFLSGKEQKFTQNLEEMLNMSEKLGSGIINAILEANPNFNYLYSNYSTSYTEPMFQFELFGASKSIINFLYGSNLEVSRNIFDAEHKTCYYC